MYKPQTIVSRVQTSVLGGHLLANLGEGLAHHGADDRASGEHAEHEDAAEHEVIDEVTRPVDLAVRLD